MWRKYTFIAHVWEALLCFLSGRVVFLTHSEKGFTACHARHSISYYLVSAVRKLF